MTTSLADTATWLRRLSPAAAPWVRLVCFPHAGGTASYFRGWRVDLPPDVDFYAVQYPGRFDRVSEPCILEMDRLADGITQALAPLADRPLALFGHSMGAAVAHEVARRLPERTGRPVAGLFVSGRAAPQRVRPGSAHLGSDDVLWEEVRRLGGAPPEVLDDPEVREAVLPALRGDYRLIETYRPRPGPPLTCPVSALTGADDPEVGPGDAEAWADSTRGSFRLRTFPGGHFYLADRQAEVVNEVLDRLADTLARRPGAADGP